MLQGTLGQEDPLEKGIARHCSGNKRCYSELGDKLSAFEQPPI